VSKCVITGCVLLHPNDDGRYAHGDLYDCGSYWTVVFNPNWQDGYVPEGSKTVIPLGDCFFRENDSGYGTFSCEKRDAQLSPEAVEYIRDSDERFRNRLLGG
jgi:hypothetical protein